MVTEERFSLMDFAGTETVTLQVAVFPLFDFAVMVAVPAPFAVTFPPLTVATELLLVLQVTDLFVALEGDTVAVSV